MYRGEVDHGVVTRIHRLQISRRKGVAALRALERRGLVHPEVVFTCASFIKLFDLPPEARKLCRAQSLGPLPSPTEGGLLHNYLVHRAAAQFRSEGWTVEKEARVSDNLTLDILAERTERRLAVLVETGRSNVKDNLRKTVAAGFTDIRLVTDNPVVQQIADRFITDCQGNVRIRLVTSAQL